MRNVFESSQDSIYIRAMRVWARFSIIVIAYGIALLHTAVPHHHAKADRRTTITYAGCLFNHSGGGLLQMIFSTDLGYGHLEVFNQSPETKIEFSSTTAPVAEVFVEALPSIPAPIMDDPEFLSGFIDKMQNRRLLFSATLFRAPPALS